MADGLYLDDDEEGVRLVFKGLADEQNLHFGYVMLHGDGG